MPTTEDNFLTREVRVSSRNGTQPFMKWSPAIFVAPLEPRVTPFEPIVTPRDPRVAPFEPIVTLQDPRVTPFESIVTV